MKMVQDISLPQITPGVRDFSFAPRDRGELVAWLRHHLGLEFPSAPVIPGHRTPLEYLVHVFFQGREGFALSKAARSPGEREEIPGETLAPDTPGPIDTVVWASRGGGKTFLGAIATALDLLYKPGIEIRILGGSLDQSKRMHAHLRKLFHKEPFAGLVRGKLSETRLALKNGSEVELLAQSHASVRGTRVQALRCDEAELFREDLFEAAMLTTRSKDIDIPGVGPVRVEGSVECLSTMHAPYGIMHRVVRECEAGARQLFRWGVLDVLGKCGAEHVCEGAPGGNRENAERAEFHGEERGRNAKRENEKNGEGETNGSGAKKAARGGEGCPLFVECGGLAKKRPGNETGEFVGHMEVRDVLRMRRRVSESTWRSEMLCLYPSRAHSVFPEFDIARHVFKEWEGERGFLIEPRPGLRESDAEGRSAIDAMLSLGARSPGFRPRRSPHSFLLCGIDFGFRAPTVILWAALTRDPGTSDGTLRILDERHVEGATTKEHVESILKGNGFYWRVPDWIGADPAGTQRQSQSGVSDVQLFRDAGLDMRARASRVEEGLRLIRARLGPAAELPRLLVHERCEHLIQAFTKYHYPPENLESRVPVKDGSDHAIDALRYLILNLDSAFKTVVRRYAGA